MEENKELEKENTNNKEESKKEEKEKKHKKNKELENLLEKNKILEEEVLRSKAELINYRKRKDEETSKIMKYANEDVILKLLLVVDNFERALAMNKDLTEEQNKFLEGFNLIYKSIIEILNSVEVKELKAENEMFDPNYHHAVTTMKDESKENGIILNVLNKGYTYKDKVIRPSLVVVNEK